MWSAGPLHIVHHERITDKKTEIVKSILLESCIKPVYLHKFVDVHKKCLTKKRLKPGPELIQLFSFSTEHEKSWISSGQVSSAIFYNFYSNKHKRH